MGFAIPTLNPGVAQQTTPPDVIRASTMLTLIEQDRFTFATSRRLVTTVGRYNTASAVPTTIIVGQFTTSPYGTGNFWFSVSGTNVRVAVQVNAVTNTFILPAPFTATSALVACGTSPSTSYGFAISLRTNVAGTGLLYGVHIEEERLASLP